MESGLRSTGQTFSSSCLAYSERAFLGGRWGALSSASFPLGDVRVQALPSSQQVSIQ